MVAFFLTQHIFGGKPRSFFVHCVSHYSAYSHIPPSILAFIFSRSGHIFPPPCIQIFQYLGVFYFLIELDRFFSGKKCITGMVLVLAGTGVGCTILTFLRMFTPKFDFANFFVPAWGVFEVPFSMEICPLSFVLPLFCTGGGGF